MRFFFLSFWSMCVFWLAEIMNIGRHNESKPYAKKKTVTCAVICSHIVITNWTKQDRKKVLVVFLRMLCIFSFNSMLISFFYIATFSTKFVMSSLVIVYLISKSAPNRVKHESVQRQLVPCILAFTHAHLNRLIPCNDPF